MAGKTGTSDDYKDAWFVGFTGNLVAGVWLGNDDGTPTNRVSGGNLPTEVWHSFMKIALKDQEPVGCRAWLAPDGIRAMQCRRKRRGQRQRRASRQKNFFKKLFGL